MNKPLAVLKDSLREAWDSKVLLVLIIMSSIFALLLASVGYRALPADEMFKDVTRDMQRVWLDHGKAPAEFGPIHGHAQMFEVKDFKELEAASNPANGRYSFTLTLDILDDKGQSMRNPPKKKKTTPDEEPKQPPTTTPFLEAVVAWNIDSAAFFSILKQGANADPTQLKNLLAVDLNQRLLEDYIRERLEFHYNVKIESVKCKDAPLVGPQEFEVVTGKSDPRNWPHSPSIFFGAANMSFLRISLGRIIFNIEDVLVNGIGAAIALALGVMVTAFYLPNMLRKGAVDLMLAKPINRVVLLLYKYLGGLSFMFIITTLSVGMIWFVVGIRSGIWNPKFLVVIPVLTFSFALLYAVSTLIAVWTRSAIAAMLVTLAFSGFLWGIGAAYSQIEQVRQLNPDWIPKWLSVTADILNTILPRTRDLDVITSKLIAETMSDADQRKTGVAQTAFPSFFGAVGGTAAWILGLLSIASWRFAKKDY